MIIEFPTALYDSLLPKQASDSQSVTFLISSTDPPRSVKTFFQLLYSEELKVLPDKIHTDRRRRANLGEFIFNVSSSKPNELSIGNKYFETGQLLDFQDVDEFDPVVTLEVPDKLEMQQNNNLLDLESVGLSEAESDDLIDKSEDKFHESVSLLNDVNANIKNKKASIDSNQRLINETRKARDAALVVYSDTSTGDFNEVIVKLNQKEQDLLAIRAGLIEDYNSLVGEANEIYEEMLKLREMVR
jgi:hypothetical protein